MSDKDNHRVADPEQETIDIEALLLKSVHGSLDAEEKAALRAWLDADPENVERYEAGRAVLETVSAAGEDPRIVQWEEPTAYERCSNIFYRFGESAQKLMRPSIALPAVASAAVAALIIVAVINLNRPAAIEPVRVATENAEVREEILPDGSVVTLGAASILEVAYTNGEREVRLFRGEAFFDVTADESRPFVVLARGAEVNVVGTQFDVSVSETSVDVAVFEGRVRVEKSSSVAGARTVATLAAGEKIAALSEGGLGGVEAVSTDDIGAWRQGKLVWVDAPLSEIVDDLNRYADAPIRLYNRDAGDIRYTLGFHVSDLDMSVVQMAEMMGLEHEQRPDGEVILR